VSGARRAASRDGSAQLGSQARRSVVSFRGVGGPGLEPLGSPSVPTSGDSLRRDRPAFQPLRDRPTWNAQRPNRRQPPPDGTASEPGA
jgi:hypothetical protein